MLTLVFAGLSPLVFGHLFPRRSYPHTAFLVTLGHSVAFGMPFCMMKTLCTSYIKDIFIKSSRRSYFLDSFFIILSLFHTTTDHAFAMSFFEALHNDMFSIAFQLLMHIFCLFAKGYIFIFTAACTKILRKFLFLSILE
jgi:hypothetical protein